MATIQVSNILGTKYIINAWSDKFRALLNQSLEKGDTVDLAGCKLGPYASSVLASFYGKLSMKDSKNPEYDAILKKNTELALIKDSIKEYPTLVLPRELTQQSFKEFASSLQPGSKWNIKVDPDNEKQLAFVTLLILMYPDIEFDLYLHGLFIYRFVVDEWKFYAEHHDQYIVFTQPGVKVVNVGSDGCVKLCDGNSLPENVYREKYMALPYEFGSKVCLQVDSKGVPTGEWKAVFEKCIKCLSIKQEKELRLRDLVNFRS